MKKLLSIAFAVLCMAGLFTSCNKGNGGMSYPNVVTVNSFLPGSWEIISWCPVDGEEESGDGTTYTFWYNAQDKYDYSDGLCTIQESGQMPQSRSYYLEPIMQGDLDGSDSEISIAVEIAIGSSHYMVSALSESSMRWQVIDFENGKVVLKNGYVVFSRRNDIN